jgi:hypothetical protein
MWPIAIGLLFTVLMLAVSAANAQPIGSPPDRTMPIVSQPLATPLSIPELPIGVPAPIIDGNCSANEWGFALSESFTDANGISGTVRLLHDTNNLYICMTGEKGSFASRFASVYLDTDNNQSPFADANDYALHINIVTGTTSSYAGTGVVNGYTPITLTGWSAASTFSGSDTAEYKIPNTLTGGACGQPFRLAVYHHWFAAVGNDYGWPSNQFFDQPATWQEVQLASTGCKNGNVLYVYQRDTATAADFKSLLERAGYVVDTIPVSVISTTVVSNYDLIIVADDTGNLNTWSGSASDIAQLTNAFKPIIGLGEGGYAFFGQVSSPIGWPHGWHGPQSQIVGTSAIPSYYLSPNDLSGLLPGPFPIYSAPSNEVGIYMTTAPASVIPIGYEPYHGPTGGYDHASLTLDGCYHLWGFSDGPTAMNGLGQLLFVNAAQYMRNFQCSRPPQPPPNCITLSKIAAPPNGSIVHPGDTIQYTLAYTVADNIQCATVRSLLIDPVPDHSLFIPGSAGPGVVPGFDGTLQWDLGPLGAGAQGNKSFKVSVLDTACRPGVITNTAKLQTVIGTYPATFTSNTTTHKLDCQPVIPPNNDPPYAESEIQVYPYPLVTGTPTQFSVRVFNNSAMSKTVTVTFQTSPNNFGIGIPFSTLAVPGNPRVVTIGPSGYAEVQINWTPDRSGHYCIAVKIESAGYTPLYTYRNLDVAEDLRPGQTDVLTFSVANPTAATANITLTVDNTCPGWTAVVNPPVIVGAVPGTIYTATLSVTPPNPAVLGTGCHIDVQGWIGDQLIGGIRKLDVPPINLPHSDPPWLEKEISTIPMVPISGTLNQVCIELNNPWNFTRTVTVTFSEADFGAGIGFTPIKPLPSTYTFNLPPNSVHKYCVNWQPMTGGTLHRCLLVTLQQPGFQNQTSQRNVNLMKRSDLSNSGSIQIPFTVGNPFSFTSKLDLNGILIVLNKWKLQFMGPGGGDPPPNLGPHEMWNGILELVPAVQLAPSVAADTTIAGDVARVDVSVNLNGELYSGFSVDFSLNQLYLPLIMK